jgi:hypothetical protein
MLSTTAFSRFPSKVPAPDPNPVVVAGTVATHSVHADQPQAGQLHQPETGRVETGRVETSRTESGQLEMGHLHATVIQISSAMQEVGALSVDQQKIGEPSPGNGSSNSGHPAAEKASVKGARRSSIEVRAADSSSSVSSPSSSEDEIDSSSGSGSVPRPWTCKQSAASRRREETFLRLVAQHKKDTDFGSLPQTWWNVVSAQPIYDLAFMLPIGVGKLTGHPELILLAGFLIEFLAKPLAMHARSGSAGSEAFDQYNLMVKLLGGRVRDIASGKTHPLDEQGNTTDPYEKFGTSKLLESWLIKMAHDDALLLGFDLAYSTKNVIPTLLHDYHFYDHKTVVGTAADIGLHATSGMAWATVMTLLSQGLRHWAYPGKYQRVQSLAVLDADIARLDSRVFDLEREIRRLKPRAHALGSTISGSTASDSGFVEVAPIVASREAARLMLNETRAARKHAEQARKEATLQSKLGKDYRATWCGERRKPAIASAVGLGIMLVPLVVTALHEIQKLASASTTLNSTHVPSFEDHLESDLLVPGVLGVALTVGGTMGSIVYVLIEGMLGCSDRWRGQNKADGEPARVKIADPGDAAGDTIGATAPEDDSVITVSSDEADGDGDSEFHSDFDSDFDLEYESASES